MNSGIKGVFDHTLPVFSEVIDICNNLLEPDNETLTGALAGLFLSVSGLSCRSSW